MEAVKSIADLRQTLAQWQKNGKTIAFVPTMGNLHAGHLALVEAAKAYGGKVVVSIFVNPTQFGPNEDFASYPRTEREDCEKLQQIGADLLFLPDISNIYHPYAKTVVSVKSLSNLHCGAFRPGHFDGVATVVCKLFNIVQPNVAFFGEKDFQQLVILKTMVEDLNIPVEIRSMETVREASGLALSSRNIYLNDAEKQVAPKFYQTLCKAKNEVETGNKNYPAIADEAVTSLQQAGFKPDYVAVCRSQDLRPAGEQDKDLVILAAAWLGKTRLIDNVKVFQ